MISLRHAVPALAATLALPLVASADPATGGSPFVTLDREAGNSAASIDATYPLIKNGDGDTVTVIHMDVNARYVDPATHVGGYINLPINFVSAQDSETSIGGLELGGIYALPVSPDAAAILHAGIVLPTAPSDGDGALTNLEAQAIARPRDYMTAFHGVSLRLGVSPVIRSGSVFARADLDVDFNLSNNLGGDVKPIVTAAGGVGVDLQGSTLAAELVYTHISSENSDDGTNLATAAISARLTSGPVHPYLAVLLPLDSNQRDEYSVAFTLGLAAPLR